MKLPRLPILKHSLILLVGGAVCFAAKTGAQPSKRAPVDFNREIRPILADNCFECHGPDEHGRKGDLRLDLATAAYESAILPGNAASSPFVERLRSHDEDDVMPPPESPRQPTEAQIDLLARWIDEGAEYEAHWSFVTPEAGELPEISDPEWPRNSIDAFTLATLDQQNLAPQPDAVPTVLARRLSLAITGLPVLPEAQEAFTARCAEDPELAIAEFVDERLASPAFGEHLAWSWLDAGRYADTNGYQADGERTMWPWRDWLVRSLNENLPYDDLTRQMIAGDLLADVSWESGDWIADPQKSELLLATGFLRNHRYDTGSGTIPAESIYENAADRMETVGTVWMGLTMQCARCHTHKFDPIEQSEYFQMMSFFDNVPELGSALRGASHPYIHTPQPTERARLLALQREAENAETAFASAVANLGEAQSDWEISLTTDAEALRVPRGIRHRYAEVPISFDGETTIEKTNKPIAMLTGDREWTVSFSFRAENEDRGAIFSSVEKPDGNRPGIQVDWIDQKLRIRRVCRWINSYIEFESRDELEPGQWYHVTFRSDGRMQGVGHHASINGEDVGMICTHPVTNDSTTKAGKAPLVLGGSPLMPGFVGDLHDLRFYDRMLDTDEIAALAESRSLAELAAIPATERTAAETRTLELAFFDSDAVPSEVAALRGRVVETRRTYRDAIRATPTTMVMQAADRGPTHRHSTGNYDTRDEVVSNGTPAFLPALDETGPDRLDFARWLTDPAHPLTARVAVNRIWQLLWGRGFVDSPENFGIQCAEPIHSELLDWLAVEYVRSGWHTKALIRLIATSRTYRQDSSASESLWAADPQNRLLARGPRFRLPVQSVRDQALALSGRLDPTIGGPPVLIDEVKGKDEKATKLPYEFSDTRRTLYTFWKRNGAHPMLAVFDVADRNQCDVRAPRTNTPLQALVTLNEPGLADCARDFAARARDQNDSLPDQLAWAWQACTGRPPQPDEAARLETAFADYLADADGDESLAWTALANVLLNLDATLSIE